jgi:maleylacetate reductase
MFAPFVHDAPAQRLVYGPGTTEKLADEVTRLGATRALVVASPGSGARIGERVIGILGARAAGLHARAVMHVPRAIIGGAIAAARDSKADAVIAIGGGSPIGLAKAIAHETHLPILALPTTFSGSEATMIFGVSEGDTKTVRPDPHVLPKTIVYDPDLIAGLPAAVTAASGMNALAHAVETLWMPTRTMVTAAYAAEAARVFTQQLAGATAGDKIARGDCLAAAWLAGAALASGTGLQHKLAHILGGLGMPHAETHAILLRHVTRFNLAQDVALRATMGATMGGDPADVLDTLMAGLPIAQRLRDVGMSEEKIVVAAEKGAALGLVSPRAVTRGDVAELLRRAF